MVNPKRKIIKIFVTFFILIVVVSAVFSYVYLNSNKGDEEIRIRYNIPGVDSYLRTYKSTPKIVLRKAKEFLKENGFCGDNIHYIFTNKYYSYSNKDDFTFHVKQYYKGIDCSGYFKINLNGDIETIHSLKTAYELALIQTESDIDYVNVIQIGIDYLKLKNNTSDGSKGMLWIDPDSQKWIYVYDVRFENQTIQLIIDGITGEILKEIRGEDIIKDWR